MYIVIQMKLLSVIHCSSLTARIYTQLYMNAPIHSIKSLWFCPLEVEFAIFLSSVPDIALDWEKPTAASAHEWVDLQLKSKLFLCEV